MCLLVDKRELSYPKELLEGLGTLSEDPVIPLPLPGAGVFEVERLRPEGGGGMHAAVCTADNIVRKWGSGVVYTAVLVAQETWMPLVPGSKNVIPIKLNFMDGGQRPVLTPTWWSHF